MKTKNKTKRIFTYLNDKWGEAEKTLNEWKAIFSRYKPIILKIDLEAKERSAGEGEQKHLNEIWKELPRNIYELTMMATTTATMNCNEIVYTHSMIHKKIACLITKTNRWHLSEAGWKITQELQQLSSLWKENLCQEFRFSFCTELSPQEISYKMTLIRDNILSKTGLKSVHVLSKHKTQTRKIGDHTKTLTDWHIHGILWPEIGDEMTYSKFYYRINKLKIQLKEKKGKNFRYGITGIHLSKIMDLQCLSSYLAKNYDEACQYRRHIKNLANGSNAPIPPDAAQHIHLYAPPKLKWGCIPWESWKHTTRLTQFMREYREASRWVAFDSSEMFNGKRDTFNDSERREIFRQATMNFQDLPWNPTVRGRDGYIYAIRGICQPWWAPLMFELKRKSTREDYALSNQKVPEELGDIRYEISITQLHRLGQAEVAPFVTPSKTRIECPLTGRPHGPQRSIRGWCENQIRCMQKDSRAESKWMQNVRQKRKK